MQRRLSLLLILVIATSNSTRLHATEHDLLSWFERARNAFYVVGIVAGLASLYSYWNKGAPKQAPAKKRSADKLVLALREPSGDELVQRRVFFSPGSSDFGLRIIDRGQRYSYKMETLQSERFADRSIKIQLLDEDEPDSWSVGTFDATDHPSGAIELRGIPEGLYAVSETVFFVLYQNKPFLSFYDLQKQRLIWETRIQGYIKNIYSSPRRLYIIFEAPQYDVVQVYERWPFQPLREFPVKLGRITDFYVEDGKIRVLYDGLHYRVFDEGAVLAGCCFSPIRHGLLDSKAIKFEHQDNQVTFIHEDGKKTVKSMTPTTATAATQYDEH